MREWIREFVMREHAWKSVVEQLDSRKDLVSSYKAQSFSRSLGLQCQVLCDLLLLYYTRRMCIEEFVHTAEARRSCWLK
jgi:hypothetical protein